MASTSTWRLRGILPTQIVKTEPQRLNLQAQNRVFETRDVNKLITFGIGPTNYIFGKLGLVTHFHPPTYKIPSLI